MKRLSVLLALLVMAAVAFGQAAAPAALPPFEFHGQLTYGFTMNEDVTNRSFADAWFTMKSNLSPTANLNVKISGAGQTGKDVLAPTLENIWAAQKLGPIWFEMGVMGMASKYYDPSDFGFGNLAYDPGDFETVAARYEGKPVNIQAWFNPTGLGTDGEARGAVNLWKSIGPLNVSVFYASEKDGIYGGSVGWSVPLGPITWVGDAEIKNDMAAEWLRWTTVNRAVHKLAEIGVDTLASEKELIEVAGELTVPINKYLSSVNGVAYNVLTSKWDVIEIGGSVKWEKVKFRFGYFVTDNAGNGYSMYVPNPPADGGAYLKVVAGW